MKCDWAPGTCDMYCCDTVDTNMAPWLFNRLKAQSILVKKSQVESSQIYL